MTKKSVTTTDEVAGLVVAGQESPVFNGLSAVKEKLAKLKEISESVYVTPGRISGVNGQVDIKTETNQTVLVGALSSVMARAKFMEEAYNVLGINSYPVVKIEGGTVAEWTKDIKLRIDVINNQEKLDALKEVERELQGLLGKEEKVAILMDKLNKL